MNSTGNGCRSRAHQGDAAHRMAIYDSLPREVRDELKAARDNLCAGCIRNKLRRDGLDWVLFGLMVNRECRRERQGREVVFVREEDLKP